MGNQSQADLAHRAPEFVGDWKIRLKVVYWELDFIHEYLPTAQRKTIVKLFTTATLILFNLTHNPQLCGLS